MLGHGDEMGRTQGGNNNAYCQDNEISWVNWNLTTEQKDLLEFTKRIIHLRRHEPVFQRRNFFQGRQLRGALKDIAFFEPNGKEMGDEAWNAGFVRSLGVLLAGDMLDEVGEAGEKIIGNTMMLLLNAHHEGIPYTLPLPKASYGWTLVFDTAEPKKLAYPIRAGVRYDLKGRATALLRATKRKETK